MSLAQSGPENPPLYTTSLLLASILVYRSATTLKAISKTSK